MNTLHWDSKYEGLRKKYFSRTQLLRSVKKNRQTDKNTAFTPTIKTNIKIMTLLQKWV